MGTFFTRVKRKIYPTPALEPGQAEDIVTTLHDMRASLRSLESALETTTKELVTQRSIVEDLRRNAFRETFNDVSAFTRTHQLSWIETIERLVDDESLSFARFGDGEFRQAVDLYYSMKFQPNSYRLSKALREVLSRPPRDSLMIGFPHIYPDQYWWIQTWDQIKPLLPEGVTYGNSNATRPPAFQFLGKDLVHRWRQVWQKKEIAVITGEGSRFELIDPLFDNVKSARFIYSTPVDAFSDYPRLLDIVDDDGGADLYLISLGPTGTLLAAELADRGRRAIDIGHISAAYQFAYEGGKWPESMPQVRPSS